MWLNATNDLEEICQCQQKAITKQVQDPGNPVGQGASPHANQPRLKEGLPGNRGLPTGSLENSKEESASMAVANKEKSRRSLERTKEESRRSLGLEKTMEKSENPAKNRALTKQDARSAGAQMENSEDPAKKRACWTPEGGDCLLKAFWGWLKDCRIPLSVLRTVLRRKPATHLIMLFPT